MKPTCSNGLVAMSVLLAACAGTMPAPPAAPTRDSRVVPNVRIGAAQIGMTEAQMLEWFGEPTRTHRINDRGDHQYFYGSPGDSLEVAFKQGRAYSISTSQSRYTTAEGVGVGASTLKLKATYGSPSRTFDWSAIGEEQLCFSNGVDVLIDLQTSQVKVITVYYTGCSAP